MNVCHLLTQVFRNRNDACWAVSQKGGEQKHMCHHLDGQLKPFWQLVFQAKTPIDLQCVCVCVCFETEVLCTLTVSLMRVIKMLWWREELCVCLQSASVPASFRKKPWGWNGQNMSLQIVLSCLIPRSTNTANLPNSAQPARGLYIFLVLLNTAALFEAPSHHPLAKTVFV